jgi:hypothetical protein
MICPDNRTLIFVALFIGLSSPAACNRRDEDGGKVVKAAKTFNDRFNASQFHEIYIDADPRLRNSVSEVDFTAKLSDLRRQHGSIDSSSVNGFEGKTFWDRVLPRSKSTRFIGYYNHCTSGGFQSLFVFDITGDQAKLVEFDTDIDEHNRKLLH